MACPDEDCKGGLVLGHRRLSDSVDALSSAFHAYREEREREKATREEQLKAHLKKFTWTSAVIFGLFSVMTFFNALSNHNVNSVLINTTDRMVAAQSKMTSDIDQVRREYSNALSIKFNQANEIEQRLDARIDRIERSAK